MGVTGLLLLGPFYTIQTKKGPNILKGSVLLLLLGFPFSAIMLT